MITLELTQVQVELGEAAGVNGAPPSKILAFRDPQSGVRVVIPLDANSSRMIAAHLEGRPVVQIANGVPPKPQGRS